MNFAKANQILQNLGNVFHDQVSGPSIGVDVVGVDIAYVFDGNRLVEQVAHQIVKAILTGNRDDSPFVDQIFRLFETLKLWPDDDGDAKDGWFHGVVQPSGKSTANISNIGI